MKLFQPWKVLHLRVQDSWDDLIEEPGIGGLFVVFWSDDIPLGEILIPASMLPIPAAHLAATAASIIAQVVGHRLLGSGFEPPLPVPAHHQIRPAAPDLEGLLALDQPLKQLSQLADQHTSGLTDPSISLVICTRNRPERLEHCLRSVRTLSPPPDEVIVVDNDPTPGATRAVVANFPEVSYVREARPGLSAARNTGVINCRSEIIAFTDDDVIVHPGWIGAIRAALSDQDIIAVTGLVLPVELATRAQYAFQVDPSGVHWGYRTVDFDQAFFASTKDVGAPVWRLGAGANMAFRREAFERVGLFDERLGAGAAGCSEDSELWYRLLAEGHDCRYAPTAVVFHHHRATWDELCQQAFSYMRGHVAALLCQFERYGHWGNIYRAFLFLPWHLGKLAYFSAKRRAARLLFDSDQESVAPPVRPQILGAIAGLGYYVRHRHLHPDAPAPLDHRRRLSSMDSQP